MTNLSASSAEARLGAKPPSSPTLVLCPASLSCFLSAWNTSAPTRTASAKVGAAIDDVHERHRQRARIGAADIAIERLVEIDGRRLGRGEADAEDGVGAKPPLVGGAVQIDQHAVERHLIGGVEARERIEDLAVDCLDGALDALAAIASLVAVAELDRLMRAGRRARRHGGAAQG